MLLSGGTWLVWSTNGYDAASRLAVVSDGTNSAEYTYLTGSSLATNIVFRQSGNERMRTTKYFDTLNRLTAIVSSNSVAGVVSSHAYTYNAANQRARADLGGTSSESPTYWVYTYDSLGQVISGKKYWADGTPVAGQQFEYAFDDIGNRKTAASGGDSWGANLRYEDYTANPLNQYTRRTVPGRTDILGAAHSNATVTILTGSDGIAGPFPNALTGIYPTTRKGEYFRGEVFFDNRTGAVWLAVTNLAVLRAATTNDPDVLTSNEGHLFVPRTPEVFSYDADGNLLSDGRWNYTWDAENRLVRVESRSETPAASWRRVEWQYDALGRRIRQITSDGSSGSWQVTEDLKFVSDPVLFGRHIAELNGTNNAVVRSYVWGLDLSGSLDGAGGVGGLLWLTPHGSAVTPHFCAYDGNGNVVALVHAADGAETARYEYGPFGEALRVTGPAAALNPFRFSTKRTDSTTDLVLYEYRAYNPSTGRWPNRDPIGEPGGLNLYGFLGNNPLSKYDRLGLQWAGYPDMPGTPKPPPSPPPRPYPPPNSPDVKYPNLKVIKNYNANCCDTAQKINDELAELKRRFTMAKDYVDTKGLIADPYGEGNGHASCYRSNIKILSFIEETPPCWICFMDRRKDYFVGEQDENFIRCYTKNSIGVRKEVIFDWYESAGGAGYGIGTGIYEGADMQKYEKHHPYYTRDYYPAVPRCRDCSSKDPPWKPAWSILDSLWTTEVNM